MEAATGVSRMRHTERVANNQRLFGDWLPWKEVDRLLAFGKALKPQVPTSPAQLLQLTIKIVADRLLGRRLTVRFGDTDVTLTPVELENEFRTLGLATGQIANIRFVARHVRWEHTTLDRVELDLTDVRLRTLPTPYLVVGTVEVKLTVTSAELHHWVKQVQPDILAEITAEGKVRARWARMPLLGHIELRPSVGESVIYLDPTRIQVRTRVLPIAHRIRPFAITVPDLPRGLQLTKIETGPRELVIHGVTEQLRERLTSIPVTELLSNLVKLVDQFT